VSLVFTVIAAAATPAAPGPALVAGLALLIVQLCVVFVVLRSAFRLSLGRTFAPLGVYVALILGQAVLTLFVIKPFGVEAFVLPTTGMSPTIEPGDRFVVNKIVRPRRLDVVAYRSREDPSAIYCQRLIGLPGETLRFDQGGVFVNDQPVALPAVLAGRCHASPAAVPANMARYRDGESIVLGNDDYFLIGDNVDVSADSRLAGPTPASSLVGVVDLVYWPLPKARVMR
jgi:signal peptidase I